ncbi:hypothetical protein [Gabonibacter massiliensis]|uniref:hypothetical protein n=1 Tax=Gabonibacter massiliensis TaxID=1720195 RepID=UPI00073F4FB1|nr:hypothetical protein [Gabonibacter massiliensis]
MKQILYTLLCSIMIVGTISCGNSNKKKPASGNLSGKQKKELRQLAKKIKVKLEEKKNRIIKTINTPYGDNSTVYTFDGDKCIGYKETIAFTDAETAKKTHDGLKEVNDLSHTMKNLSVNGKILSYEYSQETIDGMYEGMTRAQVLEQIKKEIKQSEEFFK